MCACVNEAKKIKPSYFPSKNKMKLQEIKVHFGQDQFKMFIIIYDECINLVT